ncbi:MAG: hypothetical protein ABJC24_10480 [Chloroflexota bacterium]
MTRIQDLPRLLEVMSPEVRQRAQALFDVSLVEGLTDPPPELTQWIERQFGSVEAVRRQQIVRVTNRWSLEGTLFSPLRSRRPHGAGSAGAFAREVQTTVGDQFCHPETGTPADTWGRVRGRRSITAANAAKYDGRHGVVIFDHHDPLAFDHESVLDMLVVGREWAERGRVEEPAAWAYLLMWNCGPRAGGSVVHGHAQVLLGRDAHYPQVERLRRDAIAYAAATGGSYLADLVVVHRELGLVVAEADSVAVVASITPVKERELLVIGQPGMDEREPAFASAVARTVVAYRDLAGVKAFNLALQRPPLNPAIAAADGWQLLPPVVRLVDRGDPDSRSSDIGAMELYAASVVGGDPYQLTQDLRGKLGD